MNALHAYGAILAAAFSTLFASPAYPAIAVYIDRQAWETALYTGQFDHFHEQDFENTPTGSLFTGPAFTNFFFPLDIIISGPPGFNAIDDSFTSDPFSNTLSPNGSAYYLGDVNVGAQVEPVLSFPELEYVVTGFGADWVIQGDLVMEIQGTVIALNTYLPTGSGFLGIITDRPESPLVGNLSGVAVFGLDDIITANAVPVPAAAWLFSSGLLGLASIAKRKKSVQ